MSRARATLALIAGCLLLGLAFLAALDDDELRALRDHLRGFARLIVDLYKEQKAKGQEDD